MTTDALVPPAQPRFSMRWIVSPKVDIPWFILGSLAAYALLALHAGFGVDMIAVWFVWVVLLDSPHFFGTISRTYMDREEMRNRRSLLLWSLLWFLVGPAVIGVCWLLMNAGVGHWKTPWTTFVLLFNLWAYWHVVRQHYGFLRLYERKNNDTNPIDFKLDSAMLYGGLLLPFGAFILRHPDARPQFGLGPTPGPEMMIVTALEVLFAALVATYVVRQVAKWRKGEPLNGPKLLFLLSVIPLYAVICLWDATLTAPLLGFAAFVTIFHDLQYHAIVWFHNRNRYHAPGVDPERFGLAAKVSRNFVTYALAAIASAAFFRFLGCGLDLFPGCTPLLATGTMPLFGTIHWSDLLASMFLGFSMHHYWVDQFIWKPSQSKDLQRELKLAA
ncbi:MAG: hypothetical protein IT186_15810 [Acidobacteria bacterium]|nr:hypothetical protein [Acidobacteriota bacterium]MCG3194921.1 hypothetical protein [Thermoanaerobaculia bacterium]MCK6682692.1 hypothetical protein [Thermoanaerobaculia bacterium]